MHNKVIKNIKTKLTNHKKSGQLILMMLLTVITQIVSILKTSTVASQFGASTHMDAFNFSNSIGTFIFSFIGAGVTTVLIPSLANDEDEEATNIFITILYSVAFIILIIAYIFRGFILKTLSSGGEEFLFVASNVMMITLLTQFITSLMGATNAIFQCSGKFNFPKFINLFTTVILVVAIIISDNLSIYTYAIYIFIATLINVITQIVLAINTGYRFKFEFDYKNEKFKKMMKIFLPTMLSTGLYQVSLVTDTIISSNLGEGQVSILSYSNTIMTMINAILLGNLITYLYPKIAKEINNENSQESLFDSILVLNGIMCLMVVGFFTIGKDGIELLYQRGKFTEAITKTVYICGVIYMIGMPINAARDLIYRYFYAKGDTITPFKNSLIISILNIVISIGLSFVFGIYGIILGTVVTSYMSLIMIMIRFNTKFKIRYSKRVLVYENLKLIIISCATVIVNSIFMNILPSFNTIINIFVYGIITIAVYALGIILCKSKIIKLKL